MPDTPTVPRTCACLDRDELVCAELRWYGYYPALDQRELGTQYCGCVCHQNWDEDDGDDYDA